MSQFGKGMGMEWARDKNIPREMNVTSTIWNPTGILGICDSKVAS
jgi:hypothetical protein